MIKYIDLTIDFAKRNDRLNGITLDRVTTRSYDTAIKFRIEIVGHALDETYDVKILSKYHKSGLSVMTTLGDNLEIVDGKLIYTPKVNLITEADYVRNYLYLSKDGLGLDMAQFNYQVDVSQIGEVVVEVKQVYDESYETLLAEFEQALEDYKLTLPQADSVRAEIDVVLSQFGVDSQAKLNQYDADAQQVIADNQTAFGLAETGRQDSYVQAETARNQASNQMLADWEQDADALLETLEGNESTRVDAEATRETAETDRVLSETTRKTNETIRIGNEDERKSAEDIRLANEVERVNAENVRAEFYEGFDGEIANLQTEISKKANKVAINNLVANGDFSNGTATVATGFYPQASTTNPRLVDGVQYWTGSTTASSGSLLVYNLNLVTDDIYYMRVLTNNISLVYASKIVLNTQNNDGVQSSTFTVVVDNPVLTFRVRTINEESSVSNFQIINLTQTFGAGNEPTKAEMDELIKITGYFDEITLTQKQLLNWQLNLMRQNRNALIALGGTII